MNIYVLLNDPAYGTERGYNGLRLAMTLLTQEQDAEVTVFLMGDAVTCAKAGQKSPDLQPGAHVIAQGRGAALRHLHGRARHDRGRSARARGAAR